MDVADKIIKLDANNVRAWVDRGVSAQKMKDLDEASNLSTARWSSSRRTSPPWNRRSPRESEGGLRDDGAGVRRPAAIDPRNRHAHIDMAMALEKLGRTEGAVGEYDAELAIDESDRVI